MSRQYFRIRQKMAEFEAFTVPEISTSWRVFPVESGISPLEIWIRRARQSPQNPSPGPNHAQESLNTMRDDPLVKKMQKIGAERRQSSRGEY